MKLTSKKLKQIIKEELNIVMGRKEKERLINEIKTLAKRGQIKVNETGLNQKSVFELKQIHEGLIDSIKSAAKKGMTAAALLAALQGGGDIAQAGDTAPQGAEISQAAGVTAEVPSPHDDPTEFKLANVGETKVQLDAHFENAIFFLYSDAPFEAGQHGNNLGAKKKPSGYVVKNLRLSKNNKEITVIPTKAGQTFKIKTSR